jgi:thiamine biosynthesis lipoprotein
VIRAVAALALLTVVGACQLAGPPPRIVSDGRVAMGTLLEMQLVVRESDGSSEFDSLFATVAELESHVSHYVPTSDVALLSENAGSGLRAVDPSVHELAELSLRYAELTSGAFDVTIGRLVDVWKTEIPTEVTYELVAAARKASGIEHLKVDAGGRVGLYTAGIALDFGGIAKGWALDRLRPQLEEHGVEAALFSFGQSSIWAHGVPPELKGDYPGWTLALRSPAGGFAGSVTLRDQALSVSSSFPPDTPHASVIIDPRTGWPVERRAMAVVVGGEAALAEALSTALLVLDFEAGLALVESIPGTEAILVDEDGRVAASSKWQATSNFEELGTGFRGLSPLAR